MLDFSALLNIRQYWTQLKTNHPKLDTFLSSVKGKTPCAGMEIAIAIRYPDGTEYKTGIRVNEEDLALLNTLKNL